jgi:hypothetical protein
MEAQNSSKRTARTLSRVIVQTAVISAAVTGSCVAASIVAARAMHEPRFRNVIRRFNHRALNPLTLRFAGTRLRVYAKLQRTGRRTGRAYSTPLVARPLGDGFVVPLPYGNP